MIGMFTLAQPRTILNTGVKTKINISHLKVHFKQL